MAQIFSCGLLTCYAVHYETLNIGGIYRHVIHVSLFH